MYCVRNWMTDADFCKRLWMSPVTLRNWRRRWSIPVQMVHKLKKILDINFMDLHAVNTDGIE